MEKVWMLIKTITGLVILGAVLTFFVKSCSAIHESDRVRAEEASKNAAQLMEWDRLQALKAKQARMEHPSPPLPAPAPAVEQISNNPAPQIKPPTYSKSDLRQIEKANNTGRYEDLPDRIKYANNNKNPSCQKIIAAVRRLENDPQFETTKQIRLQWQQKFDEASRIGCEL